MHRINNPTSVDQRFVDGDPNAGKKGTIVDAAILNSFQEEIANSIEGFGIPLDPENDHQLFDVLKSILSVRDKVSGYEYSAGTITSAYNAGIADIVIPPGKVLDITIDFEGSSNYGQARSLIVWGIVNKSNNEEMDFRQVDFVSKGAAHSVRLVAKNETLTNITAKVAVKSDIESLSCNYNYIRGTLG